MPERATRRSSMPACSFGRIFTQKHSCLKRTGFSPANNYETFKTFVRYIHKSSKCLTSDCQFYQPSYNTSGDISRGMSCRFVDKCTVLKQHALPIDDGLVTLRDTPRNRKCTKSNRYRSGLFGTWTTACSFQVCSIFYCDFSKSKVVAKRANTISLYYPE